MAYGSDSMDVGSMLGGSYSPDQIAAIHAQRHAAYDARTQAMLPQYQSQYNSLGTGNGLNQGQADYLNNNTGAAQMLRQNGIIDNNALNSADLMRNGQTLGTLYNGNMNSTFSQQAGGNASTIGGQIANGQLPKLGQVSAQQQPGGLGLIGQYLNRNSMPTRTFNGIGNGLQSQLGRQPNLGQQLVQRFDAGYDTTPQQPQNNNGRLVRYPITSPNGVFGPLHGSNPNTPVSPPVGQPQASVNPHLGGLYGATMGGPQYGAGYQLGRGR